MSWTIKLVDEMAGLAPLTFTAPGAMRIRRPAAAWSDISIDQGREYEFFPCADRPGYSNALPGEWCFRPTDPNWSSYRVLAKDVPEVHAIICDLMLNKRDPSMCECCGSRDRVSNGPWACEVFIDLAVTDASLCFGCANYRPVGETGPIVRDARLPKSMSEKRLKQIKKVEKLKEFEFRARLDSPMYIVFSRLRLEACIKDGQFVEFCRTDTGWALDVDTESGDKTKSIRMTDPECILWVHRELRRIQKRIRLNDAKKHEAVVSKVKAVQKTRFETIFEELE